MSLGLLFESATTYNYTYQALKMISAMITSFVDLFLLVLFLYFDKRRKKSPLKPSTRP